MVTIKRNGMSVDCHGKWQEGSNCVIIGTDARGLDMEAVWAGDGWPMNKAAPVNWTQVVEHLTAWACSIGAEIDELEEC